MFHDFSGLIKKDAIRTNLTVNGHHYHIPSKKAPIKPVVPSLLKTRPRGRSRGASLSSTYTAVTRSLPRPLIIQQINGEVVAKVDPSFVPRAMLFPNVDSDEDDMCATMTGTYVPSSGVYLAHKKKANEY